MPVLNTQNDSVGEKIVFESKKYTLHERFIIESGKEMLVGSIRTGREFCKYMISVSSGAIPIYLGLLKLVLPANYIITWWLKVLIFGTPVVFLIAVIIFVFGYFPHTTNCKLNDIETIRREREATISKRKRRYKWGLTLFLIGVSSTIASVGYIILGF